MPGKNEVPAPGSATAPPDFLIVAIGASAGGISALRTFFRQVPPDSGMAYVVILHLSPDFESRLAEILQSACALPVQGISEERVLVKPNCVYVMPPAKSLTMVDGHLALAPVESYEERRAPIDIFFRTLADTNDGRAVAIVLSGTGSDGSMGMRRIKENGGIVLVQAPEEAEYSDMPNASIAQGLVDFVLPVGQMVQKLMDFRERRKETRLVMPAPKEDAEEVQENALRSIFMQLRVKTGHDFSNYKRATLLRRIERRMNVRALDNLTAYASFLKQDKEEPQTLLKELLISVTNFFRDRAAFEALETKILPRIFGNKGPEGSVRIWVAACATGEEAYSMAMLCTELQDALPDPLPVQVFATDIDSAALAIAREGCYTEADVADVSPERLRRFFVKEGSNFRVRRELRETVLFARHNILKDPPFSHLDLGACRNMLIYLNRTAQARVMETFHFALVPGGYLFLGSSETADSHSELFATVDRENSVFQNRAVSGRAVLPLPEPPLFAYSTVAEPQLPAAPRPATVLSIPGLHHQLLELYGPPSVLVNAEYDILHVSASAGRYLQMAGEPSVNLLALVKPELRLELRGALYSATQTGTVTHTVPLPVLVGETAEMVVLVVKPVAGELEAARGFLLVQFKEAAGNVSETKAANAALTGPIVQHFEEELVRTRMQLRQTSEQYEVQSEEFKASNEELQAINEELRSAAEELETSKEELQSVNEELLAVNGELKIKIEELSQSNNDFKNLINATSIGTLFLDRSFTVNLYTPAATEIFNLKPADFGRPLSDITNHLKGVHLATDAAAVLESLQPMEREVQTNQGGTFLMRILPYRTSEDHISGLVVTFVDITARKSAEEALRASEERMRALFEQATAGVAQAGLDGSLNLVNQRYGSILGYEEGELLGTEMALLVHPDDLAAWEATLAGVMEKGLPAQTEMRHLHKDGRVVWLHNSLTRITDSQGNAHSLLCISIDLTTQKSWSSKKKILLALPAMNSKHRLPVCWLMPKCCGSGFVRWAMPALKA